jgi:hypothetical protein
MALPSSPASSNYNNSAMDLLNQDPSAPPPADDQQPEPGDQSSTIQKVPGGFQVSVVVPTIEQAHELSKQFHDAVSSEGEEPPAEGDTAAENEDASDANEREGIDAEP